jgi:hypothetical protein
MKRARSRRGGGGGGGGASAGLAGTVEWTVIVTSFGLVTMVMAAYIALFRDDLKGLLAYSTVSHLGLITMLFGLGVPTAAVAGVFHIINHATFKASLFMAAGIVDHETGTRDMRRLGGLFGAMPITATLAMVGAAAMAGVPLFNGFLSKEMMLTVVIEVAALELVDWLFPLLVVLGTIPLLHGYMDYYFEEWMEEFNTSFSLLGALSLVGGWMGRDMANEAQKQVPFRKLRNFYALRGGLKGKVIASNAHGSVTTYEVGKILETAGLTLKDIEIKILPFGQMGVALANKGTGRVVVDLQPDGDLMFDAGSLWIAAKYKIPMLVVMFNNRAYYNDWNHQLVLARTRGTDPSRAHIGMDLYDPDPDFAGLARSMGWHGEGPFENADDLKPALKRAIQQVKKGTPVLVDAVCDRRTHG